jgi:hypothetical protein
VSSASNREVTKLAKTLPDQKKGVNSRKTQGRAKTAGRKRSGGGATRLTGTRANDRFAFFPGLATPEKRFGVAVLLAVAQRWGANGEIRWARQEALFARPGLRPKTVLLDRANPDVLARVLSGLAHPDRIRLARAVLAGANTHHLLIEAVKIKTGPLYHHLRELERAGLLSMIARNAYMLTDFGRTALFVTAVLGMQPCDPDSRVWKVGRITENTGRQRKSSTAKQKRGRDRPG